MSTPAPITPSRDRFGRSILTVGQLRDVLEELDDDTHVVIATGEWYTNIGEIAAGQPDDDSEWSCLTLFPGTEFDARQF